MPKQTSLQTLARYPLLDALRDRRSRRFGLGMKMNSGPLAFSSDAEPVRLSEDEEAALAFAACGVTGPALGDLVYTPEGGGSIMAGLLGRTVASGDAIQTVSVFVINDDSTCLLKRPRDFNPQEIPALVRLARDGELTELYHRSRVEIAASRTAPPLHPMFNLDVNQWSLYDSASSYFLPVNELTLMYINGLLSILDRRTAAFILDERAHFRPAGLKRFARKHGGHLHDDPGDQRVLTIQQLESLVTEFVTIEQGMVLQNLALMTQALGLGGFPHWAAHPFGWLEALGFRMQQIPASRYLGMGWLLACLARLSGRDQPIPMALGLERNGEPLLTPYCPPYHADMRAAVEAVVALKYGDDGVFRGGVNRGAWRRPQDIGASVEAPADETVEATVAYCDYVFRRYGRFPDYQPPFRTVLGFQASHIDPEFYQRFYDLGVLSDTQRSHMQTWHGN